jgi:hypothetical protein
MKIPTLILLSLFLFIFKSCGQNGLNNGNLFLLQKDNNTISINSYKNEIINEINNFKISEKSIYTTDQKERVVVLDTAKMSLKIYDINSTKQSDISIPFDIKPKTILLNNENIFVGGEQGKEILIQFNLKSEKWYQLEIPKEIQTYGKAVDDLVINNSLLIAVDNIILPKYILYYNLNSKDKLEFSHLKELKSNSSYESIHKARISNNNLGLLSTTVNHGTIREHITLYEDLNLLKSFAITIGYKKNGTFRDFIIVDDKLFIASSSKGLGVLKIKKSFFKESENRFDIFNAKVDENLINYKKIRNGEIIKLTKIPNEQKIILSIKNIKGEIRNEIREIK